MRRKITAGLILRKDGRYQRNELIGDKRRTFTAKDPAKVWADIQKAQENTRSRSASVSLPAILGRCSLSCQTSTRQLWKR